MSFLKSAIIDWCLLNKLFVFDYYLFDDAAHRRVKNDMYTYLHWFGRPVKFWASFAGLFTLVFNIFRFVSISYDAKYGVSRYYNDDRCRKTPQKTSSDPYLWRYDKLLKVAHPNWCRDKLIEKEVAFFKDNYEHIKKWHDDNIKLTCEHPEETTSLESGNWKRIAIYGVQGWNKKFDSALSDKIKANCRIAYNHGLVFFSKTGANTKIIGHTGSSNLRIRLHLGIDVPYKNKTIMRVAREKLLWENGNVIAFDDSFFHSSENNSSKNRTVFILDIFNPHLSDLECDFLKLDVIKNLGKIK